MALRDVARRRLRGARSSLSRTTSDFEILRPRDSASMSATKGSGNRTRQLCKTSSRTSVTPDKLVMTKNRGPRTSSLQDRLAQQDPLQAFEVGGTVQVAKG